MTWITVILIVVLVILKMLTTPPSAVVGWVVGKFALHPKLDPKDVTVTFNGKRLEVEEKNKFTDYFNEALFLERNHIFPGTEKLYLQPEIDVVPYVLDVKSKKRALNFSVYIYDDQVEVIKQWKKKVASYTLSSDNLQKFANSNN